MAVFKSFALLSDSMETRAAKILAQEVLKFNARIMQDWPVDTGTSRRAWQLKKVNELEWHMTNDVSYSPIVWVAQRPNVKKVDNIIWWHGAGGELLLNHTVNEIGRRLLL